MRYSVSLDKIPESTTRKRVEELASAYGEVVEVPYPKFLRQDLRTGHFLGSGFIQYARKEDAVTAAKALQGYELDGKKIEAYESFMEY